MIEARNNVGGASRRWPGNTADDSAQRDTWLFVQDITGNPAADETAENELREWLEEITHPSPTDGLRGL